jgi:hypothetical protein
MPTSVHTHRTLDWLSGARSDPTELPRGGWAILEYVSRGRITANIFLYPPVLGVQRRPQKAPVHQPKGPEAVGRGESVLLELCFRNIGGDGCQARSGEATQNLG